MNGGDQSFGAGGWIGSKIEEVMPVNMDIPAQRQMPKGALVLVIHSCEMPDGNYWGEQCAIKAVEALTARDEIGVLSFAWKGGAGGGAQGDFSLAPEGRAGNPGLKDSDARQKHAIIVSDGDPAAPNAQLVQDYNDAKVTVSTISV